MQTKQSMNFEMFRESSFCMRVYDCLLYYPTRRSSLIYTEVWKRRWRIASTHTQRVVWSLLITNDLLTDMVIVLWRINFKSIPYMKEHFCRQSCYRCLVAKHDQVVEKVVVHFVQLSFFNALEIKSILSFEFSSKDRCCTPLRL